MKTYVLLLVILTITGSTVFPANSEKKDQFGIEWCYRHKPSLDENQLRCLHSLDEAQMIKEGITGIVQRHHTCPKCKNVILDEKKYLSYYPYPFLMIDAGYAERESGNERGSGEVYHFIFKRGLPQIFTAYFTLNDDDARIFFLIDTFPTNKKMVELIKTLRGKEFDRFWISAP